MKFDNLEMERIDFTAFPQWRWRVRRIWIGFLLFFYYLYAIGFLLTFIIPDEVSEKTTSTERHAQAQSYDSAANPANPAKPANPDNPDKPANPANPASASDANYWFKNHYFLMVTFGFLGSIYALTRTFVITQNKIDYPVAWYITRPLQGMLMALFLYFAFQAGQMVFFSSGGNANTDSINVFTLSILAILAGLFSEHAYSRLYVLADKLIKPKPEDLAAEN